MHGREVSWIAKDNALILRQLWYNSTNLQEVIYDLATHDSHLEFDNKSHGLIIKKSEVRKSCFTYPNDD